MDCDCSHFRCVKEKMELFDASSLHPTDAGSNNGSIRRSGSCWSDAPVSDGDEPIPGEAGGVTAGADTAASYLYAPPITSPFYHRIISPLCDLLVNHYVPVWVTPNQLSFSGLLCALIAVVLARLGVYWGVAPMWVLYALFDNLDGKQARRTHRSSQGGDFVDHAVDSIVASLSGTVLLNIMAPHTLNSSLTILLTMASQLPFYLGCWAHYALGRVLLGTSLQGTADVFTVDEVNFLVVPLLVAVRCLVPDVLDYRLWELPLWIARSWNLPQTITLGTTVVIGVVIAANSCSLLIMYRVCTRRIFSLLLPGVVFSTLTFLLHPPLLVVVPCFSLMSFELIVLRLRLPKTSAQNLWYPVVLFALVSVCCTVRGIHVTWGLSSPYAAVLSLILCCLALAFMIQYKEALNRVSVARTQ